MGRTSHLLLATVIAIAVVSSAQAEEPQLEYGPVGGDWKVATGLRSGDQVLSGSGGLAIAEGGGRRVFWGKGYKVGPDGDGAYVEIRGDNRPRRSVAEGESQISPESRRHYASISCEETTFQGFPATRCEGVLVHNRHHQIWMDVEVDPRGPRTLMISWEIKGPTDANFAATTQRLQALLSTFRIVTEAPPASVWKAEIRVPRNLKPGDILSPSVVVTDQNGREPTEPVQVRWLINGQWAESITWDGSRTELEVQVSVEHQAVVAKAVVEAWKPPSTTTAPPKAPPSQPPVPVEPAEPPKSTEPPKAGTEANPAVPGLGGAGGLPGPRSIKEALISIIGPAGLGLIGALMSGLLGGGGASPDTTPQPPPPKPPEKEKKHPKSKEEPSEAKTEGKSTKTKRKPTAETVKKRQAEAEKAKKEAEGAGGVMGLLGKTLSNVKAELGEAAKTVGLAVVKVSGAGVNAVRQLAKDPKGTIDKVVKATGDALKTGAKFASDVGKAGLRIAKDAYNDPQAALEKLKQGAQGLYTSLKNFLSDPKKMWEAVKEWTGINNFGNALDPNRSLLDRVGQVGVGVFKLYGTLTTANAVATKLKSGASAVVKGAKQLVTKPPSRAEMKQLAKEWVDELKHKRTLGGKASAIRPGNAAADLSGFTKEERKFIEAVANKHGVQVHVRPRGELARTLIEEGKALPKPEMIKAKTVNKLDTMLGFSDDAGGVVACKQPVMPGRRPPGMDAETWSKLEGRCAQRMQEFKDQASKLHKLEQKGKIRWDRKSGVVYDAKTGKPFTGDHDMFAYTDPHGNPVSPYVREQISRDLMNAPHPHSPGRGMIEHPEHMSWDLNKVPDARAPGASRSPREVAAGIKQVIIDKHAPGEEALITFHPEGAPTSSYYLEG